VRHRGGGGRGAGHRRMRRSLAGTRGVEKAGALVGEAMGRGRGAHRWWGGVRRSRKRRSPTGEAWGGGGGGGVGRVVFGRATRGWAARCRSGSMGSGGWCRAGGRAGRANTRGVGRLSARGSVDRLDRWVQMMDLWSITLGDE
jgi:hypothetical protein